MGVKLSDEHDELEGEPIQTKRGWYYVSRTRKDGRYRLWVGPFANAQEAILDADAVAAANATPVLGKFDRWGLHILAALAAIYLAYQTIGIGEYELAVYMAALSVLAIATRWVSEDIARKCAGAAFASTILTWCIGAAFFAISNVLFGEDLLMVKHRRLFLVSCLLLSLLLLGFFIFVENFKDQFEAALFDGKASAKKCTEQRLGTGEDDLGNP